MHQPVLLKEVIECLNLKPGYSVLDGTVGSGGHAEAILEAIRPNGSLIGLDQDPAALARARQRLSEASNRMTLVHSNFSNLDEVLRNLNIESVHAVLLDVGFSLDQIEDEARGFSLRREGPLDMRMDQSRSLTAREVLMNASEHELTQLFWDYGEERNARRIARAIVSDRVRQPIETTVQLAQLVERLTPPKFRYRRIHPATRVFQALRIAVNDELEVLKVALPKALRFLKSGGRIAVISFHSLEDRIVKRQYQEWVKKGVARVITKKPVQPSASEIERNTMSRSAKLRVAEKAA